MKSRPCVASVVIAACLIYFACMWQLLRSKSRLKHARPHAASSARLLLGATPDPSSLRICVYQNEEVYEVMKQEMPPAPTLLSCPPEVKLQRDNVIRETLETCYNQSQLKFHPCLETWTYSKKIMCGGKIALFDSSAVLLNDVLVDKGHCRGAGCECYNRAHCGCQDGVRCDLKIAVDSPLELRPGFFQVPCEGEPLPKPHVRGESHIGTWFSAVSSLNSSASVAHIDHRFAIAVQRYEYDNLFHTITDVYNAMLAVKYFGKNSSDILILLLDDKPKGYSYHVWKAAFKSVIPLSELPTKTFFPSLFWNMVGYDSELAASPKTVPYLEEFRNLFLDASGVFTDHRLNCSNVHVTFISRQDFNNRTIDRKIANENELIFAISANISKYWNAKVQRVRLEELSFEEQLQLMSVTDVLIGSHGAGLTHTLLVPPTSAVLELLPVNFHRANEFFLRFAKWRNVTYERWKNTDEQTVVTPEASKYPPEKIVEIVYRMMSKKCSVKQQRSPR